MRPHVSMAQGVTHLPREAGYLRSLSCSPWRAAAPGVVGASLTLLEAIGCRTVASRRNSVESNGCEATTSRMPCSICVYSRELRPTGFSYPARVRTNSGMTISSRASKPASLQKTARRWAMALCMRLMQPPFLHMRKWSGPLTRSALQIGLLPLATSERAAAE